VLATQNKHRLAIVGFGDLGSRLMASLDPGYYALGVFKRSRITLPFPDAVYFAADTTSGEGLEALVGYQPHTVMVTLTPSEPSIQGYAMGYVQAAYQIAKRLRECASVTRVIYVSSTRVYAERMGGWVTEYSALDRKDDYARLLLEAEDIIRELPLQTTILRAAGLYSGPSHFYLRRLQSGVKSSSEPPIYTNRIHRDDVAGFMRHLLEATQAWAPTYNLSDGRPLPKHEIEALAAAHFGLAIDTLDDEVLAAPPSHKRIANDLMLSTGFKLAFPDVRQAYSIA